MKLFNAKSVCEDPSKDVTTKVNGGQEPDIQRTTKRIAHIDVIKGWSILSIIIFHADQSCVSGLWANLLGNHWNVAVFFIIAGFFLKEEVLGQPSRLLKTKFKRLYVPAAIIYALCILLHNVFVRIGWYPLDGCHPYTGDPFILFGWKEICLGLVKVLAACGSGELAMGAMWFIYSLIYAFVGMTTLYWLICLSCKNKEKRFHLMTIILLLIASVSCILSQRFGITVSRISISATAMFLIWWGMIINQKFNWKYNKWWVLVIAFFVFVHCVIMQRGGMTLARNKYQDLILLTVGSTAAIYVWGFIGRKIENSFIGKFLAFLGRESLYLMAFHIIGFFICNSLLVKVGVFTNSDEMGLYTYNVGNNFLLLLMYVLFAIGTTFVILYGYRGLRRFIIPG